MMDASRLELIPSGRIELTEAPADSNTRNLQSTLVENEDEINPSQRRVFSQT